MSKEQERAAKDAAADALSKEQFDVLMGRIASLEKQNKRDKAGQAGKVGGGAVEVAENERRMQEPVKIRLFKDNGKYKDDVFVAVNGKGYQIRRGVEVEVPRFVKEVLDNSSKQDEDAAKYAEGLADEYEMSNN